MSEGLNRVMLLGCLGADPELRTTSGGQAVLKFRLACSESYLDRNKERQERTEWVSCVMWGKRAESLSRILNKGDRIYAEGSLRTSSYEDKNNEKRFKTEVNVENVILCGGRGAPKQDAPKQKQGGGFDGPEYDAPTDDQSFPF